MSDKATQTEGMSATKQDSKENGRKRTGVNNSHLVEGYPQYIAAPKERVLPGNNNSRIVLGSDRPADITSGHGGAGETHCATITMTVGSQGIKAKDVNSAGEKLYCDPDLTKDAATVYISQTTNADENFGLADGNVGKSDAKSAIVLKADDLRHVSRQGIKLVTGTDKKNSRDKDINVHYGVDLIGGNNDGDMQPMVKGKNLVEALKELNTEIKKLNGTLAGFIQYQMTFNIATLGHFHITIFPLMPTTPDLFFLPSMGVPQLTNMASRSMRSLATQKHRLSTWKQNYLEPHGKGKGAAGRSYINSSWHQLN